MRALPARRESTDAPGRGGLLRSSDEAGVMPAERRERAIAIWLGSTGNGRSPMFNGRRQPSCGGTSRMTRECQVRFCEGLGVKFPGPTRHKRRSRTVRSKSGVPMTADQRGVLIYFGSGHRSRHSAARQIGSYSITWSAVASTPMPRARAVCRLRTKRNLLDCCTGTGGQFHSDKAVSGHQ